MTLNGLLYLDLKCGFQFSMVLNFMTSITNDLEFLVPNESERIKFLNYPNNKYLKQSHHFVSESLNSVLNTIYRRGFINKAACVEGIHTFYSDRRYKYRIFID